MLRSFLIGTLLVAAAFAALPAAAAEETATCEVAVDSSVASFCTGTCEPRCGPPQQPCEPMCLFGSDVGSVFLAPSTTCNVVSPLLDDPTTAPGAALCLVYSACWPFCDGIWERVPWDRLP